MSKATEVSVFGGLLVFFVAAPYFPQWVYQLSDNILIKAILFVVLIASAYHGPLMAVATFIVIAYIFILRNKIKVDSLTGQSSDYMEVKQSDAITSIVAPETAPAQPAFEIPDSDSHPFAPYAETGSNAFYKVDRSFDMKPPALPTQSVLGSEIVADQLYGDVQPRID
jgi:hypothetical protein